MGIGREGSRDPPPGCGMEMASRVRSRAEPQLAGQEVL